MVKEEQNRKWREKERESVCVCVRENRRGENIHTLDFNEQTQTNKQTYTNKQTNENTNTNKTKQNKLIQSQKYYTHDFT